nr:hypothetical protein BaRGS_024391 [Batillaria attramentaria]
MDRAAMDDWADGSVSVIVLAAELLDPTPSPGGIPGLAPAARLTVTGSPALKHTKQSGSTLLLGCIPDDIRINSTDWGLRELFLVSTRFKPCPARATNEKISKYCKPER